MKKILLTSIAMVMALMPAVAQPQTQSMKDNIVDNDIQYPESIDSDVKDMMTEWYFRRYAVIDSLAKQDVVKNVSDAEYIDRLQKLPTVVEMPFNSVVKQYIEMYALKRPQLIQKMLGLSLYYEPIFIDALEARSLPQELKYLPIIESALNPNAVSKAGAAGLWQFMPSTATGKGLEVNSLVDERRDPIRSSRAAADYLEELYKIYGDWHLVLAAYNCGPGNVNKAMRNSGKRDFWEIYNYLPKETRGYVPAFIAATYVMNNYGKHGITPAAARTPIITDTVTVTNRVNFKQISDVLGITVEELRSLNPQFRKDIIPGDIKPYTLILPSKQAWCYRVNEDSILNHDRRTYERRVVVEPGNGNSLTKSDIEQAQAQTEANKTGTDDKGEYVDEANIKYHTVQRGETLMSIAEQYGVTAEDIRRDNDLDSNKLSRGKKLKIVTYNRTYATDAKSKTNTATPTVAAKPQPTTTAPASAPVSRVTAPATTTPAKTYRGSGNSKASTSRTNAYNNRSQQKTTVKKQQPKNVTHQVKSGESLERIAKRNGVSVKDLKRANGLKNDNLKPGQKLTIPQKGSSGARATQTKSSKSSTAGATKATSKNRKTTPAATSKGKSAAKSKSTGKSTQKSTAKGKKK